MINSDNCIVAFLDILGYEQWLENFTPVEAREIISRHFYSLEVGKLFDSSPFKTFYESVSMYSLSDSIIIVLQESEGLEHAFPGSGGKEESKITCYQHFMGVVSSVAFGLTSDSKLLIRGAITFGQFYQSSLHPAKHNFIFSKALHKAYNLERQADVPRIIVDDTLIKKGYFESHTLRDTDGQYCLDIYVVNAPMNLERREKYLGEIVTSLKEQWNRVSKMVGKKKTEVLHKLYWFSRYHNRSVDKLYELEQIKDKDKFKIALPPFLS